jgi:hypothetical protein
VRLNLILLLFLFVALYKVALAHSYILNSVLLSETKRKKTKKRNVLKHHQKVTAQPDVLEVQAGKVVQKIFFNFVSLSVGYTRVRKKS